MSGYASITATRRAFFVLTALRWLPTGLLIPISVLFLLSRGMTLTEVGMATAASSVVIVLLELPTGGLADAWGRRPVLAIASAFAVVGTAVLLAANSLGVLLIAMVLNGVYRALDSGPLDSWYVDAALVVDPGRDLARDLSGASAILYGAIAAGSLLAGGFSLLDGLPVDPLTAAVAAALILEVVHLIGVLVFVREVGVGRGRSAAWAAARRAPVVVAESIRLGRRRRPLRLLLAVELSWSAGLVAVELLWQPMLSAELGSAEETWAFGLAAAAGWIAGAVGAGLLPQLIRLTGGRVTWAAALMRLLQGGATIALALVGGVTGVVTGYVAFYLIHGAANPAHFTLLHKNVGAAHRTAVLSLNSLVGRLSALPAGIAFGFLADHAGIPLSLLVAGALMTTAIPLYLLSGEPESAEPTGPVGSPVGSSTNATSATEPTPGV